MSEQNLSTEVEEADCAAGHEWKVVDSDIGGNRTNVECVNCGIPGERNDDTGEVYWPAT